ncbi:DUF1684 domain-containing protein [Streptomyces sp. NPDC048258]|uniref:DUF1684 domain-containing protein n=1 Tax=Streptomyces sp. NPDC048258 TaxID=3365527 RepID=UPI00371BCEF4
MSDDADDPPADRRKRQERRAAAVSAPYGPLALTGALPPDSAGPADHPEGRIPAVPGSRRAGGAGVVESAAAEDSVRPDGEPSTGDAALASLTGGHAGSATVGLDRAVLPPRAFADRFICPFPPPGNTPPFAVAAGERRLKGALATGN